MMDPDIILKGNSSCLDMAECQWAFYDSGFLENINLLLKVPMVVVQHSTSSCSHLSLTKI